MTETSGTTTGLYTPPSTAVSSTPHVPGYFPEHDVAVDGTADETKLDGKSHTVPGMAYGGNDIIKEEEGSDEHGTDAGIGDSEEDDAVYSDGG